MAPDLEFQGSTLLLRTQNPNNDIEINVSHFWHIEENHINNHEATTSGDGNRSRALMGFQLPSEERVREMIARETEHLPNDDYVTNLCSGNPREMIARETEHLPNDDYVNHHCSGNLVFSVRTEAVDWIYEACSRHKFGPLSACLSVNYLDRFLSTSSLPSEAWVAKLLAVACLSLAVKMEEVQVPLLEDFQVEDEEFLFDAKTITSMEMTVLSRLKWRLHVLTPFSFIDYFLSKITSDHHNILSTPESIQLILSTIKGIELLGFRASEVSAALAICILEGGMPPRKIDDEIVSKLNHVDKVRVSKCVEVIEEKMMSEKSDKVEEGQTPNKVLDGAACFSYKSDEASSPSSAAAKSSLKPS